MFQLNRLLSTDKIRKDNHSSEYTALKNILEEQLKYSWQSRNKSPNT